MALPELQDTSGRLTDCIYFGDPISSSVGSGFVATTRTIGTTLPLTGGGDLSANRTLAINDFAGSVAGAVPPSTGGVVTFLRADGAWATPPTFGAAAAGYAPASGGGVVNYLRADGTWAAPAGSTISGLTIGYVPVADSATSIVDSRIYQDTNSFTFITADDGAGTSSGLDVREDGICVGIRPFQVVPLPSFGAKGLFLSGSGASYGGSSGISIVGGNVTINGPGSLGTLTHYGEWAMPFKEFTLANGYNPYTDLALTWSHNRIVGPTAAFSIGGILGSATDGLWCVLYNSTTQPMTILNEDLIALDATRIRTLTGDDIVLGGNGGCATFIYDTVEYRWILVYANPAAHPPLTSGYLPYESASAEFADSTLFHDSANNRYGVATATPKATVDVNGTVAVRRYAQLLSNGLNSDIPEPTTSFMRITGPSASFSVGGIVPVASSDGTKLTIYNATSQAMTIVHEDASSTAANRINTLTASDIVFPARQSVVHLAYNSATSRWIVEEANPVTAGGATTQVQFNSTGTLSGDTGLTVTGTDTALYVTLGTDVIVSRKDTRHVEFGVPNSSPKEYIVAGNSSRGGTDSNKRGGKLSVGGGAGSGTGGGGDTALITAYQGSLGNTQNSFVDRAVLAAKSVTLTESSATKVMTVAVAAGEGAGGTLWYTIFASDATNHQMRRGRVIWAAVNKSGTVTPVLGTPEEAVAVSSGTLTVTVTAVDNTANGVDFKLNAVSSLTQTSLYAWVSMDHDGKGVVTTV